MDTDQIDYCARLKVDLDAARAELSVWQLVRDEQARAHDLHGPRWVGHPAYITNERRLPILVEEVGEVAEAIQAGDVVALRVELTQVAAVAVSWLQALDPPPPVDPLAAEAEWQAEGRRRRQRRLNRYVAAVKLCEVHAGEHECGVEWEHCGPHECQWCGTLWHLPEDVSELCGEMGSQ